jgi:hypothetical protein
MRVILNWRNHSRTLTVTGVPAQTLLPNSPALELRQGCDGHAYESVLRPAAHLR